MGVIRGPKPVILEGLVFYTDVKNQRCYVSGSETIYSLVTINTTVSGSGTDVGGENWDGVDQGYFSLDGTDDYMTFSLQDSPIIAAAACSVCIWIRSQSQKLTMINSGYVNDYILAAYGLLNTDGQYNGYYTGSLYNNASVGGGQFYINGISGSSYLGNEEWNHYTAPAVRFNSGEWYHTGVRISGYSSTAWRFSGDVGPIMIYDRELSPTEIQYNYNVQKGRFGL